MGADYGEAPDDVVGDATVFDESQQVSAAFTLLENVGRRYAAKYHPLDYDPNRVCYSEYPRRADFAKDPWDKGEDRGYIVPQVSHMIRAWFRDTVDPTMRHDFRECGDEERYTRNVEHG